MSLKGLVAKTNWLVVNRQSWSYSDSDSDSDSDSEYNGVQNSSRDEK
jgi:hypothetical protein